MAKKLARSTEDKWIGGICGGIADYTGVDANLIRLATVVLTLVGVGSVIVIYLLAWMIMPKATPPGPQPTAHEPPPPSV